MRPASYLPNCVELLQLGKVCLFLLLIRKTPKCLAQLNTLLPETVPFLILTKVPLGLASRLLKAAVLGVGGPCSSEDCISQYSSQSLSQGTSFTHLGVTANLQDGWALSHFTGEKAEVQPGEAFWPKVTHGALRQALNGGLLAPNSVCFPLHHLSFLNVDMSSQPVICLSFPFCKNRRGERWTESWDLGRRGKKAKPTQKTNVFVSWEYGSIATLPDCVALLAGLAPGASAHWTLGNLPAAPGAPCQCQRVFLCVWYPALPISLIPRSPSFPKPPSQSRSEVRGCRVGVTAPGKEIAVPGFVQVRLKTIIFKEKKNLGHGALDRAPEPTVEVQPCQAKGIPETLPANPTPQSPPPSSSAQSALSTYLESPSGSQEDESPFHGRSQLILSH